jgi:pimeloyl-ACP methyl ester carboxylesterase
MRVVERAHNGSAPAIVLVHGSGHTARVWEPVQAALQHTSVAVNLPGRADRVAEIADVTLADAAASVATDVGRDRVNHLVFVAGLCAPHGEAVISTVRPDAVDELAGRLRSLRQEFVHCMLDPDPHVDGVRAIDAKTAAPLDSLNYMEQRMSWDGVRPTLPRTFVRCLRDRIQSRALQAALIEHCRATEVIDIKSGHTPAVAVPAELADIIDRVADESPRSTSRAIIDP